MKIIKLMNEKILYDEVELDLKKVTIETLEIIVHEIIDGDLCVEIDDKLTSPNAIFLKSLKREIDSDFIKEIKSIEHDIKCKNERLENLKMENEKI